MSSHFSLKHEPAVIEWKENYSIDLELLTWKSENLSGELDLFTFK